MVSDDVEKEPPVGVRVDRLTEGDRVMMFGRTVTVVGIRTHSDFAGTRVLSFRTLDGISAVETLMPDDWRVLPIDVLRTVEVKCLACDGSFGLRFNVANGWPPPQTCRRCRDRRAK